MSCPKHIVVVPMPETPYVPLTCEEVDCIQSLEKWNNKRVAIFGQVIHKDLDTIQLQSLGEEKVTNLEVDIR